MAFTKADVVGHIRSRLGITKNQSSNAVGAFLELIKAALASGEDVLTSEFGKFCVKQRNNRRGRYPSTGDMMALKPRTVVAFNCSRKLRKRINEGQGSPMAEKPDPKETVTFKKVLITNGIEVQTAVQPLFQKGTITGQELYF